MLKFPSLRGILDHIPQRISWKDRECIYLGCNQAFARDMGFSNPHEVVGKTDSNFCQRDVAEQYQADDRRVMALDAPSTRCEECTFGADGEMKWVEQAKVPLHNAAGQVIGILCTYEDASAQKRARLEIERLNAELERRVADCAARLSAATLETELAIKSKNVVLGRINYEVLTSLNSILGFGQLIEMEESLGPEPRESIEEILRAGRHLLTLTDEMIGLSIAESTKLWDSSEPRS